MVYLVDLKTDDQVVSKLLKLELKCDIYVNA